MRTGAVEIFGCHHIFSFVTYLARYVLLASAPCFPTAPASGGHLDGQAESARTCLLTLVCFLALCVVRSRLCWEQTSVCARAERGGYIVFRV